MAVADRYVEPGFKSGRVDTLGVKVDKVERDVSTVLTTAIGPAQFVAMIWTSVAIFMAGVAAYG